MHDIIFLALSALISWVISNYISERDKKSQHMTSIREYICNIEIELVELKINKVSTSKLNKLVELCIESIQKYKTNANILQKLNDLKLEIKSFNERKIGDLSPEEIIKRFNNLLSVGQENISFIKGNLDKN